MPEINHELERMLTEGAGHEHGCWEIYCEVAVERYAERKGVDVDDLPIVGRHDDLIDGETIWDHYTRDVLINQTVCHCEDQGDQEE